MPEVAAAPSAAAPSRTRCTRFMPQAFQSDNFRIPRRVSVGGGERRCPLCLASAGAATLSLVPGLPVLTAVLAVLGLRQTGRDRQLRGRAWAYAAMCVACVALVVQVSLAVVAFGRLEATGANVDYVLLRGASGDARAFASAFPMPESDPTHPTAKERAPRLATSFFRLLEHRFGRLEQVEVLSPLTQRIRPDEDGVHYQLRFARQTVPASITFKPAAAPPAFLTTAQLELETEGRKLTFPPPPRDAATAANATSSTPFAAASD